MNAAFPDALRGKYQCYTQADLGALRATGGDHDFADVQTGVAGMLGQHRYLPGFGTAALHLFGSLLLTLAGIRTVTFFITSSV